MYADPAMASTISVKKNVRFIEFFFCLLQLKDHTRARELYFNKPVTLIGALMSFSHLSCGDKTIQSDNQIQFVLLMKHTLERYPDALAIYRYLIQ